MTRARLIVVLLLVSVLGGIIYLAAASREAPAPKPASASAFTSSEQCAACHREVYDEWQSSYHGLAWTDPLVRAPEQADNFAKQDCIPCHAPRPVFEHGIGKEARVVPRAANRHEGVDCLACHKVQDQVAASHTAAAPCHPVGNADLATTAVCAPCHNQHKTVDEWDATEFARRGVMCNDCHMPPAARAATSARPAYTGRSHVFVGGHDREMLQKAGSLTTEVRGAGGERVLLVSVQNVGAGHNYPTDARHRALDVVVTLIDQQGRPIAGSDLREAGQEPGTRRTRFRNPYRTESGKVDTQIRAGETGTLEVPLPAGVKLARVELIYKLTPYLADTEGTLVEQKEVEVGS
ncbi:MAG: multiheme c-type cytochrome [Planctomycetota bacterium]